MSEPIIVLLSTVAMAIKNHFFYVLVLSFNMLSATRVVSFMSCAKAVNKSVKFRLSRQFASVTGTVYESDEPDAPTVKLFTKEGCTLCDKVKDVLISVRESQPHSLEQVDITDEAHEEYFDKYKWDIPVLHVNDNYWIKHRIDEDEAVNGLVEARSSESFTPRPGEPNAKMMEQRQAEREGN